MSFELGQVVKTKGIAIACEQDKNFDKEVKQAFAKYIQGNWGIHARKIQS